MTIKWNPKLEESDQPLYLSIVQTLADDMSSGALASGTRLPTHRELADVLDVAIGTVTRAYAEAEKRGLVHSEGRRGTFVGESRGAWIERCSPFETGSPLVDLGVAGFPAYQDDPDVAAALRRLARGSLVPWLMHWTPEGSLERHREAGAAWIERLGLKVSSESIVITSGAQHAIFLILSTLLQKGDVVLSDSHSYPGFKKAAKQLGLEPIGIPMDDEALNPDALEAFCKRQKVGALYCNPTMHNPTATTMTESRRRAIAGIAEKYGFVIIEDEISRALVPNPPPLLTSIAPNRSYLIAPVSKVVTMGLRACFVVGPPGSTGALNDGVHATLLMVPPLLLEILALWLKDGTVDTTIRKRRMESAQRLLMFDEAFGSRYNALPTPFSYFAWLPLPDVWSANSFASEARSKGIVVAPADYFVLDRCQPANAVRICLGANTSRSTIQGALATLANILDNPRQSKHYHNIVALSLLYQSL
jgi:DNA-binding transcriptional MocR family regulator